MTYDPRFISPLSEALGRVIVEWNRIEHIIADIAHRLAGCLSTGAIYDSNEVLRIALMNMEMRTRLLTLKAYASMTIIDDTFSDELSEELKLVDKMRDQRNRYVHSLWYCDDGRPQRVKFGSKLNKDQNGIISHTLHSGESYISTEELATFGISLAELYNRLARLEGRVSLSVAYQNNYKKESRVQE